MQVTGRVRRQTYLTVSTGLNPSYVVIQEGYQAAVGSLKYFLVKPYIDDIAREIK